MHQLKNRSRRRCAASLGDAEAASAAHADSVLIWEFIRAALAEPAAVGEDSLHVRDIAAAIASSLVGDPVAESQLSASGRKHR